MDETTPQEVIENPTPQPAIEQTTPSKIRPVRPRDLVPPRDVNRMREERMLKRRLKNPLFKFFYIFFGEGF